MGGTRPLAAVLLRTFLAIQEFEQSERCSRPARRVVYAEWYRYIRHVWFGCDASYGNTEGHNSRILLQCSKSRLTYQFKTSTKSSIGTIAKKRRLPKSEEQYDSPHSPIIRAIPASTAHQDGYILRAGTEFSIVHETSDGDQAILASGRFVDHISFSY